MKIKLRGATEAEDLTARSDMKTIENTINRLQEVLELDSVTSDPSGFATTTGKIYMWYRSDLQQLRFIDNGTTYKIQASAV